MNYKYYDLIKRPVVTEKTNFLSAENKYTFVVANSADKFSLRDAIENIFDVRIKKINILNVKGKVKRFKGRLGKQSDYKKAIVTLEKNYKIDLGFGG